MQIKLKEIALSVLREIQELPASVSPGWLAQIDDGNGDVKRRRPTTRRHQKSDD
jgi:hypothetical protein